MLRIDVKGDDFPAEPLQNYAIPPDNPFVGVPGALEEIWAYGLRYAFRFSFDRLTGDLYSGDVGEHDREEFNFQPAESAGGENYGWPFMEGTICFNPPVDCDDGTLTAPFHDYVTPPGGAAIGGAVYRGSAIPSIYGLYFFGDLTSGGIWSCRVVDGVMTELTDRSVELEAADWGLVAIEEGGDGELYLVYWTLSNDGRIYKIVPDASVGVTPSAPASSSFSLSAPSPNPFSRTTRFAIQLRDPRDVEVSVYTAAGALVRTLHEGSRPRGDFEIEWNGRGVDERTIPAGVYFVRAMSGTESVTRRITLLR
jgi:hypothetical protein